MIRYWRNFIQADYWGWGLVLFISAIFFRYPLVNLFSDWPVSWPFPRGILYSLPILWLIVGGFSRTSILPSSINKFIVFWITFVAIGSAIYILPSNFEVGFRHLPSASATLFFIIFPALVAFSSQIRNADKLYWILYRLCQVVLICGAAVLLFEFFTTDVFNFATKKEYSKLMYQKDYTPVPDVLVVRRAGFLISKDVTAVAMAACWIFFVCHFIFNNLVSTRKETRYFFLYFVSGLLALAISDSMTIFFSASLLLGLLFITKGQTLTQKHPWLFGVLWICIWVFLTYSGERLTSYFIRGEFSTELFLPRLSGCNWWQILKGSYQVHEQCTSKEFHAFFNLFRFGLPMTLFWYIALLSPMWLIPYSLFKKAPLTPGLMGAACFSLATLHYSGAEAWGNNYLFALLLLSHFVTTHRATNAKSPLAPRQND